MHLTFERVIDELALEMGLPLSIDAMGAVTLLIQSKLRVTIEPDRHEDFIILESFLGIIPPGAYRERVLKEALIYNNQVFPNGPVIGYFPQQAQLILFEKPSLIEFKVKEFAAVLTQFMNVALFWKEGLESGKSQFVVRKKEKASSIIIGRAP